MAKAKEAIEANVADGRKPIEPRHVDRTLPAEEGIAKPAANGIYTKPRAQFHLMENSDKRKGGSRGPAS